MFYKPNDGEEFHFDKTIDVEVDYDIDAYVEVDLYKTVDIEVDVCVDVNVDGNFAEVIWDAEALGTDTYVQADIFVLAIENEMSHTSGVITAAVE